MPTPARHRSFRVARASESGDPVVFDFETDDGEKFTFTCLPNPPVGPMLDMVSEGRIAMEQVYEFMSGVLVNNEWPDPPAELPRPVRLRPESTRIEELRAENPAFARFHDFLRRKDVHIEVDTLLGLVTWLVEEYGGRPTTPSTS